jgi:probable rRNA maturation factor
MKSITFFSEGIDFKIPKPLATKSWIQKVIRKEKRKLSSLAYIFCSDEFLSQINLDYLKHSTLTDIITFNYSEANGPIEGEVYISIPRVRENCLIYKTKFDEELHRVMIHGVLHLLGYSDKKPREKALMRKKEEACLSLRK